MATQERVISAPAAGGEFELVPAAPDTSNAPASGSGGYWSSIMSKIGWERSNSPSHNASHHPMLSRIGTCKTNWL